MKHGELGQEEVGEMVNPFDEFNGQRPRYNQYESIPLEEMSDPETSDFSDEFERQEKGKLREISEIDPRSRDGMINELMASLKGWEDVLRKSHETGHKFNMKTALEVINKIKNRLQIIEENPSLSPSALRKEFYRQEIGTRKYPHGQYLRKEQEESSKAVLPIRRNKLL